MVGIAMEMCCVFLLHCPCSVGENARELCLQKWQWNVKHNRLQGRTATSWLSPQYGAFNRDLLDKKSKSPLFPGAGGSGYK